jgi:two-component system response regulator PilR (NtrC family)
MAHARILVVDDEKSMRELLTFILKKEGYEVTAPERGEQALELARREPFDLVITDVRMPKVDGLEILKAVKDSAPETAVIMISAFSSVETAVEAMKLGAYDYINKPFRVEEIKLIVKNALERKRLLDENIRLQSLVANFQNRFEGIIAKSQGMKEVFETIQKIAPTSSTAMITGESGTGKELVARAIHFNINSPRRNKPFVSVNCGAMPEGLMESELFGHLKGSFTGAVANKRGLFEEADGGTLFLDEITEIPPSVQIKLHRAIQEREVRRVGDTKDFTVDVRLIAASNREIEKAVADGILREDLFYRLNVVPIHLPPLRERRGDIPLLIAHFLQKFALNFGKEIKGITPEALQVLEGYHWPGNVRELENVIERAIVLGTGENVTAEALPDSVRRQRQPQGMDLDLPEEGLDLDNTLNKLELRLLTKALERSKGVQTRAAELLRLTFRQFRYKLQKHNLHVPGRFAQPPEG